MIAHFMLCNPLPSYQPLGLRLAHYYSNFYEHVWSNTKPFTGHFNLAIIYFGLCTYFTFFTFSSMSQQEQMLYGITPAGLSPGLGITPHHTGQPGVSSQLLPGTPRLWCLAVMTPPFIIPVASSAASDIPPQPWLLSSSVEEAQRGSGSALCMQGCWLSTGPCMSKAVQALQLPRHTAQDSS